MTTTHADLNVEGFDQIEISKLEGSLQWSRSLCGFEEKWAPSLIILTVREIKGNQCHKLHYYCLYLYGTMCSYVTVGFSQQSFDKICSPVMQRMP